MRPFHLIFSLAAAVVLGLGCWGSSVEQQERAFRWRIEELDKIIARADPDTRKEIDAQKAAFLAEFAKLPQGESRSDALGKLNQKSRAYLDQAKSRVEEAAHARASQPAPPEYRQQFVGHWKGEGVEITISPSGMVDYRRFGGAGERKLTVPISSFRRDNFEAGLFGINTTFKIDRPPYDEGGVKKVVIDGVVLTRID